MGARTYSENCMDSKKNSLKQDEFYKKNLTIHEN